MKKSLPVSVLSYRQMEQILDNDTGTVGPGEEHLAALTAHDRTSWAAAREQFFSKGVNRRSMEMIEKAAYVLFFDDSSPNLLNKVSELSQWALIGCSSTVTDNAKMIVYMYLSINNLSPFNNMADIVFTNKLKLPPSEYRNITVVT